jgi:hypothetical protein
MLLNGRWVHAEANWEYLIIHRIICTKLRRGWPYEQRVLIFRMTHWKALRVHCDLRVDKPRLSLSYGSEHSMIQMLAKSLERGQVAVVDFETLLYV